MELRKQGPRPDGTLVSASIPARQVELRTIALQPRPLLTTICVSPDRRWSSVVRHWSPGDVGRCGLCPAGSCIAKRDACHLMVEGEVREADAPLLSTLGLDHGL